MLSDLLLNLEVVFFCQKTKKQSKMPRIDISTQLGVIVSQSDNWLLFISKLFPTLIAIIFVILLLKLFCAFYTFFFLTKHRNFSDAPVLHLDHSPLSLFLHFEPLHCPPLLRFGRKLNESVLRSGVKIFIETQECL